MNGYRFLVVTTIHALSLLEANLAVSTTLALAHLAPLLL